MATNPRDGPLPTVFPLDRYKLQDRLLGNRVIHLCSFGIYFPSAKPCHTSGIYKKKKKTTFHGFILYVNKRSNYLWLASIWIIPVHNVKKELPGDNGICCVIGSPSSEQTSTCHPCASTGISKRVKGNLIQF